MKCLKIVDEDGDMVTFEAGTVNPRRTFVITRRPESNVETIVYIEPDQLEGVIAFLSDRLEEVKDKYQFINSGRVQQVMDNESKEIVACFEMELGKARKVFDFMNQEL